MPAAGFASCLPECGPPRRKIAQNSVVEMQPGCAALHCFYHFAHFDTGF